jgi:Tol biopolymer transport system component
MPQGAQPSKDRPNRLPQYLKPSGDSDKSPVRDIAIVILAVAAVSALLTAGTIQLVNRERGSKVADQLRDDIELVGVSQQLAVVVVNAGERREIKLLDTEDLLVQDITRGQTTALTAALSPDGENLAFVSDSPDGPAVSLVNVKGGSPISLVGSALLKAGEDAGFNRLSICEWTNVSWSNESSRFSVFGCQKDESVIVVVNIGRTLDPVALADTRSKQEGPRKAMWLNDREILFNQKSEARGKTSLWKILADADASSVVVYGE